MRIKTKNASIFTLVLFVLSLAILACTLLTPATSSPKVQAIVSAEPSAEPVIAPTEIIKAAVTTATAVATQTSIPTPPPIPTAEQLKLEIVQSQSWTDRDGNARVNFLVHNPYDFPVAPSSRARANLMNAAGTFMRSQELYFLDGISGGNGFLLPGETIAANGCFTCERAPLTETWDSVEFESVIQDASGKWNYLTDVEATVSNVTFDGDSPIFWVTGTVKNKSDSAMNRISARIFVYDQNDNLIGASEVSSWDVGPGATVNFKGYGIGKSPDGTFKTEITALGVNY